MLHIGYVYNTEWSPANATDFSPTYGAGARLAHAWIKFTPSSAWSRLVPAPVDLSYIHDLEESAKQTKHHSTLDLIMLDGYTLITGPKSLNGVFKALQQAGDEHGIVVKRAEYGTDFLVTEEHGQGWLKGFHILEGNGVLVRPDQHILRLVDASANGPDVVASLLASLGF